ncbi:MAG: DUF167 domain-containing protein [Spirochaetota bacterium]
MEQIWHQDTKDPTTIIVRVKVIPGASRTAAAGTRLTSEGLALLVRVAAAPEKGKANEELVDWLSGELGLPKSAIVIRGGQTARLKRLAMPAACVAGLAALAGGIIQRREVVARSTGSERC